MISSGSDLHKSVAESEGERGQTSSPDWDIDDRRDRAVNEEAAREDPVEAKEDARERIFS